MNTNTTTSSSDGEWERDAVILNRDDVSDFHQENVLPQPPETLAKIRNWLKPTDFDREGGEYKKHSAAHLAGTGDWLFQSYVYNKWRTSRDQGLLWIRGIPGSGKSVFAASIIDRIRQEEQCPVLYFFFRQIIDANHSPIAAVRDMLVQLLPFSPLLQQSLNQYLPDGRDIDSISAADLWRHLRQATVYIPKVYCVVDALDEMDRTMDLEPFLNSLAELASWRPEQVKVVITSRPVAYIEGPLRTARAFHVRLEEREVDVDIATFVKYALSHTMIPLDLQQRIRAAVPGRANGLFLYARLAMDAFLKPDADVLHVLEHLPQDLNVMYTNLLREHSRRSGVPHDIQLLILQSVTHVTRPLRLLEIAEFINVTQYLPGERDLKAAKGLVRSACGPLLEILPDETVSVVHHSLTEFLNGSTRKQSGPADYPILEPGSTHNRLALICLSYLLSGCLEDDEIVKAPAFRTRYVSRFRAPLRPCQSVLLRYPFITYAAHNWHVHARKASLSGYDSNGINRMVDNLLASSAGKQWAKIAEMPWNDQDPPPPLEIGVHCGLSEYVRELLSRPEVDVAVRKSDPKMGHLLCVAAKDGKEEIVRLLLAAGADKNGHMNTGETPLLLAASHNHPRIVDILIESGLDPFMKFTINTGLRGDRKSWQTNASSTALRNGHSEVTKVILRHAKTAEQVGTMLWLSIRRERSDLVELVLQHPLVVVDGVEPLACQFELFEGFPTAGATPLIMASSNRDVHTIRLLLQAGANLNVTPRKSGPFGNNKVGDTALHALLKGRGWQCSSSGGDDDETNQKLMDALELLIRAGADVSKLDANGSSVLHHAKFPAAARLLLDAGADSNITNSSGESLLHTCNNDEIVQVLLSDPNMDLEQKESSYMLTPLLCAIRDGRLRIASSLLDKGAKTTTVDWQGAGVFHYAVNASVLMRSEKGSNQIAPLCELMRKLKESGGDPNEADSRGKTPLHILVEQGSGLIEDVFQALVAIGADTEAKDRLGRTPLSRFLSCTRFDWQGKAEMLLKAGAKLDAVDHRGRNLLHQLEDLNDTAKVDFFEAHGLDPRRTDYEGNTLWHIHLTRLVDMCYGRPKEGEEHPEPFVPLFKWAIDPLQANHSGRTPLHELCRYQDAMVAQARDHRQEFIAYSPSKNEYTSSLLDYVIKLYLSTAGHVDQQDHHGATALHLSSTHSEYNVRRLLAAGANPLKPTHEGLTPLHLAARSRKPNVVALLLEWLKSHYNEDQVSAAVNATGRSYGHAGTPLHYACVSGVSQSVQLLLEAGAADPGGKKWQSSTWYSCTGFEVEAHNWSCDVYEPNYSSPAPVALSVLLDDKHRSHKGGEPTYPSERLDEILDMLCAHFLPKLEDINDAITLAARKNLDYTVECLVRKQRKHFPGEENDVSELVCVRVCLAQRQANRAVYFSLSPNRQSAISLFHDLMRLRDYHSTVKLMMDAGGLQADQDGFTVLYDLVRGGFASILKQVATRDLIAQIDNWEFRQTLAGKIYRNNQAADVTESLLHMACRVEAPNLDVVRVLVDDLGIDVNVRSFCHNPKYPGERDSDQDRYVPDQTVLHHLAQGRHWWQLTQALPYLIAKGANLEARDAAGLTPLLTALGGISSPSFDRFTVQQLIAKGADVNARSPRGRTCLGQSVLDGEVVKELIEHGAEVTFSAVECAIRCQKPDILALLLDGGRCDPNIRETPLERQQDAKLLETVAHLSSSRIYQTRQPGEIREVDLYPLELAVKMREEYKANVAACEEMIQLLLQHGADPNAVYPGPESNTVMQRILERHEKSASLFLDIDIPVTHLERRDDNGRTLLHTACRSKPTEATVAFVNMLLDRGADVRATSSDGSTCLHHMIMGLWSDDALLGRIVRVAPDLVDHRDMAGRTPLHATLWHQFNYHYASALLCAGADPSLPDPEGNTPLHLLMAGEWHIMTEEKDGEKKKVVKDTQVKLLSQLVSAAPDGMNARNSRGETPLFVFFRHYNVRRYEHDRISEKNPVIWPIKTIITSDTDMASRLAAESLLYFGDLPVMNLLEAHGINDWQTTSTATGETLLHAVVLTRGCQNVGDPFRFLMGKGLDPLAEDDGHRTALDAAALVGQRGVLELFQKALPGSSKKGADGVDKGEVRRVGRDRPDRPDRPDRVS